ncbi:MAG: saccharopine dehydrogenase NADP-binding domain-containing protein [Candidatus Babeliales bacterium]
MAEFNRKIFIIGCGAVAQCSIPLILKYFNIAPKKISIIDPLDVRTAINDYIKQGLQFEQTSIIKNNFSMILAHYLKPGDLCIDLANEVDTLDILNWCQNHNVFYLNTCLNSWPNNEQYSAYKLYQIILKLKKQHQKNTTTAVLTHGANPGLISSFVKQGLIDAAHYFMQKTNKQREIERALENANFSNLAYLLAIKTIHITEIDSQTISTESINKFCNTWSINEFISECTADIEFAWGYHEKSHPPGAKIDNGNIFLPNKGLHSRLQSWIPHETFSGMIIPHDETYTVADYLSIAHTYRPTTLFVYKPCPAAQQLLKNFDSNKITYPEHVITNEITDGGERMGSLLINSSFSWWTGSLISIQESNKLLPGHNATVMQVAAGILTALDFIIENPQKGICFPEDLDHQKVLKIAKPYLGNVISKHVDWNISTDCLFNDYLLQL